MTILADQPTDRSASPCPGHAPWCNAHSHIAYPDGGAEGHCRGITATRDGDRRIIVDVTAGFYITEPGGDPEYNHADPGYADITLARDGKDGAAHEVTYQGPLDEMLAAFGALNGLVAR